MDSGRTYTAAWGSNFLKDLVSGRVPEVLNPLFHYEITRIIAHSIRRFDSDSYRHTHAAGDR